MRPREVVAAGAGVAGVALAHALDVAGLLPGVHEAASVRLAMSPALTVGWLALAAVLGWSAGRRGPVRVGMPAALVVSAVPELVGRHDVGALVEPGAIAGALVQWLLLVAVVAAVVLASRTFFTAHVPAYGAVAWPSPIGLRRQARSVTVARRGRPRAPPRAPL